MHDIYDGNVKDIFDKHSNELLEINSCGQFKYNSKNRYITIRERGRQDYHILFIYKGKCIAEYEDKTYTLNPGDFVVYYPTQRQKYAYHENIEHHSFWLHFSGSYAQTLLQNCNLTSGVHKASTGGDISDIKNTYTLLVTEFNTKPIMYKTKSTGLLLLLLSQLYSLENPIKKQNKHVYALEDYIHNNYSAPPDIESFAKSANLSVDRFKHLFKEHTGMPIHNYLINVRLTQAKRLLKNTDMTVKEVSYAVGYRDELYFSRIYKKHMGISPSEVK